jgi:hypothetical protein
MNCPVCLTNLTEEVKYASSVDDYVYYVFCPDCGNIIGLSTTSLKLEQVDGLVGNSDAARSYITNDRYEEDVLEVNEEPEEEVVPLLQLELEAMEEQEPEQEPVEDDRVREVPEDIQHQIDAVGFGDYLIIINDYKEADFELFTGTREELNAHLEALNLHNAPKVYTLKQLHVKTTYSV